MQRTYDGVFAIPSVPSCSSNLGQLAGPAPSQLQG